MLKLNPDTSDAFGTLEEKGVTRSVLKYKSKGPVSAPAEVRVSVILMAIFYILL